MTDFEIWMAAYLAALAGIDPMDHEIEDVIDFCSTIADHTVPAATFVRRNLEDDIA